MSSSRVRDLDNLRKLGVAPPLVDSSGSIINPHIPHFIAQAPWYSNDNKQQTQQNNNSGLKHQYNVKFAAAQPRSFASLVRPSRPASSSSSSLSCANCGASGHQEKDCLERPKSKKMRIAQASAPPPPQEDPVPTPSVSSSSPAPALVPVAESSSFASKHDRWADWDPRMFAQFVRRFDNEELERHQARLAALQQRLAQGAGASGGAGEAAHDEKAARRVERAKRKIAKIQRKMALAEAQEEAGGNADGPAPGDGAASSSDSSSSSSDDDAGGLIQRFDEKSRGTVRNLRIREDTAKYLINLNPTSAYYDPKTRSMREDPRAALAGNFAYAGDNALRNTGQAQEVAKLETFAWEANARAAGSGGVLLQAQATPSAVEQLYSSFKKARETARAEGRKKLNEKYLDERERDRAPDQPIKLDTKKNSDAPSLDAIDEAEAD